MYGNEYQKTESICLMYTCTCSWIESLFCIGVRRPLNHSDLFAHPPESDSRHLLNKFNRFGLQLCYTRTLWRSTADNIIKTFFHGQSINFLWANTNFNGQTARFHSQHMFSLSKHITLWQTFFHGQSTTFSWAKHMQVFMDKPNCMLSPASLALF